MERTTSIALAVAALCAAAAPTHAALDRMDTYRELYREDAPTRTDAPQRRALARYLDGAETAEGLRLREQAIHEVLALQPDLAPSMISACTAFTAAPLSPKDLRVQLHAMIQLFQLRPHLEASFLQAAHDFVAESGTAEGREWKARFLVAVLQVAPGLDAPRLEGIARFVNEAHGVAGRKAKMDFVLRSLTRAPGAPS